MAAGPWTWLNKAVGKPFDGTILLGSHAFKCVLLGSAQSIDATFAGTSGNAQYSDLTAELATANGYTNGGQVLAGVAVTSPAANSRQWSATDLSWTLTGSLTVKYAAIYDNTSANKDLICFVDLNPGGAAVVVTVSPMTFTLSGGILSWHS